MKVRLVLLAILALLLAGVGIPLQPQTADAASCTLETDPRSDLSYFWADMNGRVTAISGVSTVYAGFVWATTSYGDPGSLAPYNTAYDSDPEGGSNWEDSVHNSPFSFSYGGDEMGAWLIPDREYYYRFCVELGAPMNTWDYGPEAYFPVGVNPEGTWCFYGWSEPSYCTVTTSAATLAESGVAEIQGSVAWSAADGWFDTVGFVWDTQSHANPSGWPGDYGDVPPESCDYPNWEEVDGSGIGGDETFDTLLRSLDPAETYYYRAVGDRASGGDWVYGPELQFSFTGDCVLEDWMYGPPYEEPIYEGLDPISTDIWSAQNIDPSSVGDFTATSISMKMWRSGTVSTINVAVYLADEFSWYPVGLPLATGSSDVSTLTTDTEGDWITVALSSPVSFTSPNIYDVVVSSDAIFEYPAHMNCVIWVTTEDAEYALYDYMYTYDTGASWSWPSSDALYFLWDCPDYKAPLYQTWGYVPSTRPAWYQAWPSILKLLYITVTFLAALFVYRQKPKRPEYPDMMGPEV